jgi:hypothetical protein
LKRARRAWRWLKYALHRAGGPGRHRHWWVLALGVAAIVVWQISFNRSDTKLDERYRITYMSGMHNEHTFVYFYWYTGLFPVASTLAYVPCLYRCQSTRESDAPADLTREAALSVMAQFPHTLVMDIVWTWNAGDRGKIFLFLLDTWLKGAPYKPSVIPFHRLCFILALGLLFAVLWWLRRPALGAASVVFLGSNPFQLVEVHRNDNVFGWNITTAILILAIHVPLLAGRRLDWRWAIAWPIGTAILLGTIRTFRPEPMSILLAAVVTYLQTRFKGDWPKLSLWLRRSLLVAAFFAVFVAVDQAWTAYFVYKHEEARATLASIGGHPFEGPQRMHHHFWHPIWCGLGDFDREKGYVWDDKVALAYARPILEQKYHAFVPDHEFLPGLARQEYWDDAGIYKKMPFDVPHYDDIIREKVLSDIASDPWWYATILAKRIARIIYSTTPVRITWSSDYWTLAPRPIPGVLAVVLTALCVLAGVRLLWKLLLFTLPTCATAVLVFSGGGTPWYGIFHLFAAAILVLVAFELGRLGYRELRRLRRAA